MIQFYFLSIILNGLAGFVLITGRDTPEPRSEKVDEAVSGDTFRLVLGVLAALVGLLKLLSPMEGDVPLAGDLLPALAGLASGFALTFTYFKNRTTVENKKADSIDAVLRRNSRLLGFITMGTAVLHFLLPKVIFF